MKLGVDREREVTELEEARLRRLPLEPSLAQPAQATIGTRADLPDPAEQYQAQQDLLQPEGVRQPGWPK
jgi:hypothetical protein